MREAETHNPESPLMPFDIDGTLAKGYAILAFAEYLAGRNLMDQEAWKTMQADSGKWAASGRTDDDYREFATDLVNHYAQGLKGRSESDTIRRGKDFFEEVRSGESSSYRIYDYSPALVEMMGMHGRTIAVSGSPKESLDPLIHYLGIGDLRATELEVVDGVFTGNVVINMAVDTSKSDVVNKLRNHGYDETRSFAFGDSPHDSPLLAAVNKDNAFIVGANADLIEKGKGSWKVLSTPEEVMPTVKARVVEVFGGEER